MMHLWPEGHPIEVASDRLITPQQIVWQRQAHPVATIANRWRYRTDWWQTQTRREYFKLATTTGLLLVIFYDWQGQAWYLQGLYD